MRTASYYYENKPVGQAGWTYPLEGTERSSKNAVSASDSRGGHFLVCFSHWLSRYLHRDGEDKGFQ